MSPQVNKFEQVSNDGHQMSLAGTWASGSHILCLGAAGGQGVPCLISVGGGGREMAVR